MILRKRETIGEAVSYAIRIAQLQETNEVGIDQILLGCLLALARFGIVSLGPWLIDLDALGVNWMKADWLEPGKASGTKVAYSDCAVALFDRTALIAKLDGSAELGLEHMLAAFAAEEAGLMGELKQRFEFDSAAWRAAVARLELSVVGNAEGGHLQKDPIGHGEREYLTPEQAAEELGVHVQTLRAYVRTGKLPAFRLAGERSIRIRRVDLLQVLEPLPMEKTTTSKEQ